MMNKHLLSFVALVLLTTGLVAPKVSNTSITVNDSNVSSSMVDVAKQNRVVLTCMDSTGQHIDGGQGTITNVDRFGVWVTTAAHVSEGTVGCQALFPDRSLHNGTVSKVYTDSDVSVLYFNTAYWPTHASQAPLKLGEKLFAFGEAKPIITYSPDGQVIAAQFDFNDNVYTGFALAPVPGRFLRGLKRVKNMILTDVYSAPGSSGGGVYDEQGNLVALVSAGEVDNHHITFIVNLNQVWEDNHVTTFSNN